MSRCSVALLAVVLAAPPAQLILARQAPLSQSSSVVFVLEGPPDKAAKALPDAASVVVRVDGSPRRVMNVTKSGLPVSVALVVDRHDSTVTNSFESGSPWDRTRFGQAIVKQFIDRLSPNDRLLVCTFGDKLKVSGLSVGNRRDAAADLVKAVAVTDEDWQARGIVGGAKGSGIAPIWDAVTDAVDAIAALPEPRAIVLFTNGEVTGNRRSVRDAAEQALRKSVNVHVISAALDIILPQGNGFPPIESRPSANLGFLARATGGLFLQAPEADRLYRPMVEREDFRDYIMNTRTHKHPPVWDNPGPPFARVAAALDSQSQVTFDITGLTSGLHRLEILVNGAAVPARPVLVVE